MWLKMSVLCISVIIPLFNKEKYIERTLRSVLQQTFTDFEVIVVDDGSTDCGAEIVRSLPDARVRLIRQENCGVSVARNRGIMEAKADFIAFVDADDEWHPEFLSCLWAIKEQNPQGKFFAAASETINSSGAKKTFNFGYPNNFAIDLLEFMDCCMRLKSPIMSSAVLLYKPLLEQIGMFPVGQKRGEDLDTWVRLLFEVPAIYCNRPLAVYWHGLPFSACASCQDVFLEGNRMLESLEDKLLRGILLGKARERVLDYIAWYLAGPVDRLMTSGRRTEARHYILSALRSKRYRKRYLLTYLESFCPTFLKKFLSRTG